MDNTLITILGPTACGKTAAAVALAESQLSGTASRWTQVQK
ncbi:MAG: hypothetical protein SPL50_00605 [Alloprevotella sp.]|nr:hypothetical protein [Alloprevotella sp.]